MDKQTDKTDRQLDKNTYIYRHVHKVVKILDMKNDRQILIDKPTDRQTDTQTDKQIHKQTN